MHASPVLFEMPCDVSSRIPFCEPGRSTRRPTCRSSSMPPGIICPPVCSTPAAPNSAALASRRRQPASPGTVGISHRKRPPAKRPRPPRMGAGIRPACGLPGQAEAPPPGEAAAALQALATEACRLRLGLARSLSGELLAWQSARAGLRLADDRLTLAGAVRRPGAAPAGGGRRASTPTWPNPNASPPKPSWPSRGLLVARPPAASSALSARRPRSPLRLPPPGPTNTGPRRRPGGAALARPASLRHRQSLPRQPQTGRAPAPQRDTFGAPFGDSVALRISIPLASAPAAPPETAINRRGDQPRWPWADRDHSSTAPRPTTSWPLFACTPPPRPAAAWPPTTWPSPTKTWRLGGAHSKPCCGPRRRLRRRRRCCASLE